MSNQDLLKAAKRCQVGVPRRSSGAVSINWPVFKDGHLIKAERCISHNELDEAIDAARRNSE